MKDIDTTPKEPRVDDPCERFTSLYDQFYRNVLRYALQHAERDAAEDVASDVFLIAWRRRDSIPDPPLPWLLGVARNLLSKHAGRAGGDGSSPSVSPPSPVRPTWPPGMPGTTW